MLPEKNMRVGFLVSFWCHPSGSGKVGGGCTFMPVMMRCQMSPCSKPYRCSYWDKTPPCDQEPNGPSARISAMSLHFSVCCR